MHEEIKRFGREGYTDNNVETRERGIRELESEMRDRGYAPSIDNDPQYTVEFINDNKGFWFELSAYGVFVGKGEAWQVSGVTSGKKIMRYITLPR